MRFALIDGDKVVQNLIVADEGYDHPSYDTIRVQNKGVRLGDYYDPDAGDFVTPGLVIDAPDTLPNDGSTQKTIEITNTARETLQATITIADEEITTDVSPDSSYTEMVATTAAAGEEITVSALADGVGGDRAVIEVVSS